MVHCSSDYIEIIISITRNAKCCNEIIIIINLFGDNTLIQFLEFVFKIKFIKIFLFIN